MDETSLEIVDAGEMYPKEALVSDDGETTAPFILLSGEGLLYRGRSADGLIIITSYRFYHSEGTYINIPLLLIDSIECKEILYLYIYCKDGRSFRCIFENTEEAQKWAKRIQSCIKLPEKIDHCFAFRFLSWTREEQKDGIVSQTHYNLGALLNSKDSAVDETSAEAERMGFDLKSVWKISKVNEEYQLCPSYPRYIIVPSIILDDEMKDLATYRCSKRIPAVVWRHQQNGCVIARSSQPKVGIFGWRNTNDEKLLEGISLACDMDPGYNKVRLNGREDSFLKSDMDSDISMFCGQENEKKPVQKKLLIVDARSYAAAFTNRAKGGGYEYDGCYANCEVQFMGLANIHAIRSSFGCLRTLCATSDDLNWLSSLENTKWLHHISGLLRAALLVVNAIDVEERPVLVHCSDGWDRTPQIIALAEIMLDPYYRTKKGFQTLVEREWLEFGHKFADRCGHPDGTEDRNERCPVFLQWLDCIFQMLRQFQCHFEFNEQYLARLVLHTYSCLFGTFLCNTDGDRHTYSINHRTFSVWPVLNEKSQFHNYLYNHSTEVLRPSYQIRSLKFWSDVYLPNSSVNLGRSTVPPMEEPLLVDNSEKTNLVKTKSCDNIHSGEHLFILQRRKSDPNLENSFLDSIMVLPLINFTEETGLKVPNATNEELIQNVSAEESVHFDNIKTNNASERTSKSLDTAPNSNLVLREPTIDGSTDTLVSESGAIIQEQCESNPKELCKAFSDSKLVCSVSTDTSDLPVHVENVLQSVTQNINCIDNRLPEWCQNAYGAYIYSKRIDVPNSISCSYTTPNHSRTPSSGFPATPCDDPSDLPNLKKESSSCQIMDFDGLSIVSDAVQDRIKKLILHYKTKVNNLNVELSDVRAQFIQHICRLYDGKEGHCIDGEDAPSLADSASSGEQPAESGGSDSSWDYVWTADHGTSNGGM